MLKVGNSGKNQSDEEKTRIKKIDPWKFIKDLFISAAFGMRRGAK